MEKNQKHESEQQERAYLAWLREQIQQAIHRMEQVVREQFGNVTELKNYLSESKADMDHVEKVGVRQSVNEMAMMGEHSAREWSRLGKLIGSPYFGRIDFKEQSASAEQKVYIGIHSFHDEKGSHYLIHDWRSPIASMFYDFELGEAHYTAPSGIVAGSISLKRQYRILKGELVFVIESALSIRDEILQQELSRPGNDKMKHIVATIQRDQNAIIRNTDAHTLVIQGAAGSGKTSIALHRIAFLLYQQKETISSCDILIVSPNKVFADYISNVLPELGEENMRETTIEDLAAMLLGSQFKFQSFYGQLADLLSGKSKKLEERVKFKSTVRFLEQLDAYILDVRANNLSFVPLMVGMATFSEEWLANAFARNEMTPIPERINEVLVAISEEFEHRYGRTLRKDERDTARKQLTAMFRQTKLLALYKDFYSWIEEPGMFHLLKGGVLEHGDVFPLIYLKQHLEGLDYPVTVKHLVIDEMQDYTPLHYHVFAQLFPCKKTILGDANQSVNPLSASSAEKIQGILSGADCVYMNKSYRSTKEISDFAQRIQRNDQLIAIERHGEPVQCLSFADKPEELAYMRGRALGYRGRGHQSLAILCKTQDEANAVAEALTDVGEPIHLLDESSSAFSKGIIVSTSYLAKGLEFDEVLVPHCSRQQYKNEMERHLLYVACTRAMHQLTLTYQGQLSALVLDVAEG